MKNLIKALLFLGFLNAGFASAQEIPTGGISVLPAIEHGGFYMGDPTPLGTTKTVTVQGMPFRLAVRTIGASGSKNLWDFQMAVTTAVPIAKNDVLLASFWMRCVRSLEESGTGQTAFVFQHNGEPWTNAIEKSAAAGQEWQRFFIPFKSVEDLKTGEGLMAFRLGYEAQTLEFGGIEVVNYGKKRRLEELPKTKVTYKGMQVDAAWRAQAEKRIIKNRTAELKLKIVDAAGRAVEGARVEILQTRSAFLWGTAVQAKRLTRQKTSKNSDTDKYRRAVKTWFNSAVIENALKAPAIEGDWGDDWGWDAAVEGVNWLKNNGLTQRGHVLVWPSWTNSPKAWQAFKKNPQALKAAILTHIDEVAGGMAGQVQHWDVVNEPFDNVAITNLLGQKSLAAWFKAAREADPQAKRYLNDYSILAGGKGNTEHRQHFEKTIRYLLKKKAPLQGLGMQGHFDAGLTAPVDLKDLLDRYAKFKLPILVTEYDMVQDDEELAGAYTRDFLTMMYSHPAVEGVLLWGFWDGAHWKQNAPLLRKDWTLKPAGQVWKNLVLKKWKTKATVLSDSKGRVSLRAHLGDYAFRVKKDGKELRANMTLNKKTKTLTLTLK